MVVFDKAVIEFVGIAYDQHLRSGCPTACDRYSKLHDGANQPATQVLLSGMRLKKYHNPIQHVSTLSGETGTFYLLSIALTYRVKKWHRQNRCDLLYGMRVHCEVHQPQSIVGYG